MIKNNFTQLKIFAFIFILSFLLSLIIFAIYQINFGVVNLCDDNFATLFDLKLKLTIETTNFRIHTVIYEQYSDLQEQILKLRPAQRNTEFVDFIINNREDARVKMIDSITKVRSLESAIFRIEPNFVSPIVHHEYPRIGGR
jgi:hypothetical protein